MKELPHKEMLEVVESLSLECQLSLADLPGTPENVPIKEALSQRSRWQIVAATADTTDQAVLQHLLFYGASTGTYAHRVAEASAWNIEDATVLVEAFLIRSDLRDLIPDVLRSQREGSGWELTVEEYQRRGAVADVVSVVVGPCVDAGFEDVDYAPFARYLTTAPEVAEIGHSGAHLLLRKIAFWLCDVSSGTARRFAAPDQMEKLIRWFAGCTDIERLLAARLAEAGVVKDRSLDAPVREVRVLT